MHGYEVYQQMMQYFNTEVLQGAALEEAGRRKSPKQSIHSGAAASRSYIRGTQSLVH